METCKSSSGCVVSYGGHTLKHAGSIQSAIALSSGESEFYSAVKGAALLLSHKALLYAYGVDTSKLQLQIHTDSSASKGVCERLGIGKLKHVQVRFMWLQERVARRELSV